MRVLEFHILKRKSMVKSIISANLITVANFYLVLVISRDMGRFTSESKAITAGTVGKHITRDQIWNDMLTCSVV